MLATTKILYSQNVFFILLVISFFLIALIKGLYWKYAKLLFMGAFSQRYINQYLRESNTFTERVNAITFFLMIVAWPYVHTSPDILVKAFTSYVLYPHGPVLEIMNGNYYETVNTPRTYFFNFFILRFPIFILIT